MDKPDNFYLDCDKALASTLLFFGVGRACKAIDKLASRSNEVEAQSRLVAALTHRYEKVSSKAQQALRNLQDIGAINIFCATWVKGRDARLGNLIEECRYLASSPAEARLLSHFKVGATILLQNADEVTIAIRALEDKEPKIQAAAAQALRGLKASAAIDILCTSWVKSRDARLGNLIEECRYLASSPAEALLLSHFKVGATSLLQNADEVTIAIRALEDKEPKIQAAAAQALRGLKASAAIDRFCRLAQDKSVSAATKLAVECRYRPSEPEEAAVFLILTGQIDAYFQEHDGLRDLRAGYGRSDEATRIRLMTVARTGDARLVEFILRPRLSLRQCSDKELAETLATHLRRKDWPRLFNDCRALPLRHSHGGWQSLISGGWSPTDPGDAALFTAVAAEFKTSAEPLPPLVAPKGTSAVFERWLAEGRQSALTSLGESALLQKLAAATPPEAVPLVSALATLPQTSEATRKQVATSEHWMIRLAGLATGLTQDLAGSIDVSNDRNFWVRELAGADAVWNFWPEDSTPVLLQKLDSAPREAWIGESGRVRRILRILLAHGMTGGIWVQDTVAIDQDAIVVTKIETAPMKRKN